MSKEAVQSVIIRYCATRRIDKTTSTLAHPSVEIRKLGSDSYAPERNLRVQVENFDRSLIHEICDTSDLFMTHLWTI